MAIGHRIMHHWTSGMQYAWKDKCQHFFSQTEVIDNPNLHLPMTLSKSNHSEVPTTYVLHGRYEALNCTVPSCTST